MTCTRLGSMPRLADTPACVAARCRRRATRATSHTASCSSSASWPRRALGSPPRGATPTGSGPRARCARQTLRGRLRFHTVVAWLLQGIDVPVALYEEIVAVRNWPRRLRRPLAWRCPDLSSVSHRCSLAQGAGRRRARPCCDAQRAVEECSRSSKRHEAPDLPGLERGERPVDQADRHEQAAHGEQHVGHRPHLAHARLDRLRLQLQVCKSTSRTLTTVSSVVSTASSIRADATVEDANTTGTAHA